MPLCARVHSTQISAQSKAPVRSVLNSSSFKEEYCRHSRGLTACQSGESQQQLARWPSASSLKNTCKILLPPTKSKPSAPKVSPLPPGWRPAAPLYPFDRMVTAGEVEVGKTPEVPSPAATVSSLSLPRLAADPPPPPLRIRLLGLFWVSMQCWDRNTHQHQVTSRGPYSPPAHKSTPPEALSSFREGRDVACHLCTSPTPRRSTYWSCALGW